MADNLILEVVTPQSTLLSTEADYVTIPGIVGELGVLAGHIPLLTSLKSGVLSYKKDSEEKKVAIHYGYAEISKDKITVLAKIAELGENIDLDRTKDAHKRAEENLVKIDDKIKESQRVAALESKLMRSLTRQIASK